MSVRGQATHISLHGNKHFDCYFCENTFIAFLWQDPNENHDAPDELLIEASDDNFYPVDEDLEVSVICISCVMNTFLS